MLRPQLEFASLFFNKKRNGKVIPVHGLSRPSGNFGGSLLKGNNNPKVKRPLDSKLPVHLVLRANQGGMRLPKVYGRIENIISESARRSGVKVYSHANVGNHLHLVIKISNRRLWQRFIREITGRIALLMKIAGIVPRKAKFWKYRPFTRLINGWRKAYRIAVQYVELNDLEARRLISRVDTKTLREIRAVWAES